MDLFQHSDQMSSSFVSSSPTRQNYFSQKKKSSREKVFLPPQGEVQSKWQPCARTTARRLGGLVWLQYHPTSHPFSPDRIMAVFGEFPSRGFPSLLHQSVQVYAEPYACGRQAKISCTHIGLRWSPTVVHHVLAFTSENKKKKKWRRGGAES